MRVLNNPLNPVGMHWMILPDLERESTRDEEKKNLVLDAWYVIKPSRNLEKSVKSSSEKSSIRAAFNLY